MDSAPAAPDGPPLSLDEAMEPFSSPLPQSLDEAPEPLVAAPPPVVAVLVTHAAGPWLEDALAGLAAQDYPQLAVLVVDSGSADDPTARIAEVLPTAYVRRVGGEGGFAAAANVALESVEGAAFLFFCHDDVMADPSAVRLLVEEAYRSNAGIVGPKVVAADDPRVLLEVGMSVDRFGEPWSGLEPGELDQEQHDAVRDVFFVSSAAMLVRADLFGELGGFDVALFPGAEDLDLCWRARLAGARVLVAPDARVKHVRATDEGVRSTPVATMAHRHRVEAALKSSSAWTLAVIVPFGVLIAMFESVAFLVTRRRSRAREVLGAWFGGLRAWPRLRARRRAVQTARVVPDVELRELQVRGSQRLRHLFARHPVAEERLAALSRAGRGRVARAASGLWQPAGWVALAVAVVYLVGSRALLLHRVPAVGSLLDWPSAGTLLRTYASGWRESGVGAASPGAPIVAVTGLWATLFLGMTGLARTVLVLGAVPVGAYGAYRLGRPLGASRGPALTAALVYAINPVSRNAIANGRLGPLVFFAIAPFVVQAVLRAAGGAAVADDDNTTTRRDVSDARRARRTALLVLTALVAVATAFFPPALALCMLPAVALVLEAPFAGGVRFALRAVWTSVIVAVGALVLLMPWPLSLLGGRPVGAALGLSQFPDLSVAQILRFDTGPFGGGIVWWGIVVAAFLALLVGTGPRLAWAARAWMLSLVAFAAVWLPERLVPGRPMAAPEGALALAALGLSLAVGAGAAVLADDIRNFRFGWRQVAAVTATVGLVAPLLGFVVDAAPGRWAMPARGWNQSLAWMGTEPEQGGFRVLWVGDPAVLPLDPWLLREQLAYGITRDGPGDVRVLQPVPARDANSLAGQAIAAALDGHTELLGHLLAPLGVRYLALPDRRGPGSSRVVGRPPGVAAAIASQLDLGRLEAEPGMLLYENQAWAPIASVVPSNGNDPAVPVDSPVSLVAGLRTELAGAEALGSAPAPTGTVLLSETYDSRWHASSGGHRLEHVRTFGWANGWLLPAGGSVHLSYNGQMLRDLAVVVQSLLWIGLAYALWRLRGRRRVLRSGAPSPGASDPGDRLAPDTALDRVPDVLAYPAVVGGVPPADAPAEPPPVPSPGSAA